MATDLSPEELKKLQDSIAGLTKQAQDSAKKNGEAIKDQIKAAKEAIREKRQEIINGTKAGKVRKELLSLLELENDALEKRIEAEEKARDATRKVASAFGGLFRAAEQGTGSISSFTDVFKDRGVFGQAVSGLGNRLDTNIETFRQLSQVGANFGQSIVTLRQSAALAALPLDDFAKLIGENSSALAALFGSATEGAKQVGALSESVRRDGVQSLAPLGFTVDEINETLLLNLERQRRTNVFDQLSTDQRIRSAINFATELDRLAKLTGQQRDELRKAIEQQQSNERFQAFLQGATDESRRRLELFAGTIANISPELAEGFQDLIANAGVPVTDAALELVQNVPQIRTVVNDLISGTVNAEQALIRTRDLSAASVDRFRKATVTGQVEFTRLQGGFINLGRRLISVEGINAELEDGATSLTQGLTTFEDATKRLSGQFQQIETGLLQAFGPALGGLSTGIQGLMGTLGGVASGLAQVPVLTGTAIAGILGGKFLFSKGEQIGIVAAGVKLGNDGLSKLMAGLGMGRGGALARAGMGVGRIIPGIGAAVGVGSSAAMLGNEDTRGQGLAGLSGAAAGALIGSIIPGIGTVVGGLVGAGLGSAVGQGAYSIFGGDRQVGTSGATGQLFEPATSLLKVERGERVLNPAETNAVNNFNTQALEGKMASMVTELNNANKTLTNMVTGVNTLVAIEGRSLKAVETSARKDRNQVGLV